MRPEILVTIFQCMIFIGVIVSAIGGFGAHWANSAVQKSKENLAAKNEQALNKKIAELLNGNKELNSKVEPFEELAHKIYPAIERAEALEKLRVDFEKVRQKQDEMEDRAANRVITEEQKLYLENELSKYKGNTILIATMSQESEAMQYAQQFVSILKTAGWDVKTHQGLVMEPVYGLTLVSPNNPPETYQSAVLAHLREAGIQLDAICPPESECNNGHILNQFRLVVGAKTDA